MITNCSNCETELPFITPTYPLCANCASRICPHCQDDLDFHLDDTCPEDPEEKLRKQYVITKEDIMNVKEIIMSSIRTQWPIYRANIWG